MCNFQKPLQPPGILHFQKICPGCQKGNVFHSHLPLKFQPPDHFPQSPKIPTQNTQFSFENYFDAPSKSPLFPTTFSSLKIPQSHRITLKSHPKITKSQVKSTHSRTKTNNPTPTTKTHTIPPYRHTKNQHKNKAKTHIKALTQYAKTSLL